MVNEPDAEAQLLNAMREAWQKCMNDTKDMPHEVWVIDHKPDLTWWRGEDA